TIGAHNLVFAQGSLGSLEAFDAGTPFLSQLHDDLAAILDTVLTTQGDADGLSQTINDHILQRLTAATSQVATPPRLLVVWLDPGTFEITSPTGQSISYDIIE